MTTLHQARKRHITVYDVKRFIGRTLLYIFLIFGAIVCLLPLYWLVRSSLMKQSQIFQMRPIQWIPKPFKWSNYPEALSELPFSIYFRNTAFITLFNVLGTTLTSSICAYSFARLRWKGRELVFACVMSSMMLPFAVTLIPTFIGWQKLGFYGTFVPLMVPTWFGGGAFNIFLLRQFYKSLPKDLDEAALVDGASYLRIWAQICVPLSKPAMITVGLFAFIYNWNDFFGPLIYLTNEKNYTVGLGLQLFQGMYNARWDYLMAPAATVFAPCLLIFIIGQNYFIEGIALTGIKG